MDPRRIQKTGTEGLANKHRDNREKIASFQKRGLGDNNLPHFSCFILNTDPVQVIPDATWTSINFSYQEIDNYGIHVDIDSSQFLFTAETAGFWVLDTSVQFDTNDQQTREIRCYLNGVTALPQSQMAIDANAGKGGDGVFLQSNFMVSMNEGDYLELQVWQNSNNNRNIEHASIQGFRIGA